MALTRNYYQRISTWNAPYTFSGKEKDAETGSGYFGARYYDSGLSIWLSVDPMSDKYPSMSPYNYCANNPVILVDPDGRDVITVIEKGKITIKEQEGNDIIIFEYTGLEIKLEAHGMFREKLNEETVNNNTHTRVEGLSKSDTEKFYNLFQANTNVEWGYLSYTQTDGSIVSSFGNSGERDTESAISADALRAPSGVTNLRYDHSHQTYGFGCQNYRPTTSGGSGGLNGDIEYWKDLLVNHPTASVGITYGTKTISYIRDGKKTKSYELNRPRVLK